MSDLGYPNPAAFRRALTDRLRAKAAASQWTLEQLQRQFAYDRLLERLYFVDDGWIVKGAVALQARGIGVRASLDIDLYRDVDASMAEDQLREAARRDLGDWFRFDVVSSQAVAGAGRRVLVVASVAVTEWARFHVDIVGSNIRMTGQPDDVPPLARVAMPNVEQHGYKAYPLVDHIADKVCATLERHGPTEAPSTRYRDLVDLVAIIRCASVSAHAQGTALRSEADRRGLRLPDRFDVPDRVLWESGYEHEAANWPLPTVRSVVEALAIVRPFLDPILQGRTDGVWDPERGVWQ